MQTEPARRPPHQSRHQRLFHLILFAVVVAYAALLSVAFAKGIWLVGADGKPVATDFVSFWSAGRLVLEGHAASAYDWTTHKDVATAAGIAIKGYFSFQYPPTFLLLTPLLALAAYPVAMVLWSAVGISLYLSAVRVITGGWNATLAALAWPAVLWNTVVGQTGFLTAALLGAGIALVERRPAVAGVLFGLLTIKPQFGLLIPVALIAGGRWSVVLWAALSATALGVLSLLFFGTPVWTGFFDSIVRVNQAILTDGGTDFSKLQSLYGYMRALGFSPDTAWLAHGALVAVLAVGIFWLWRSDLPYDVKAAALAAATLLASPYAYVYDLVALAVPLAFLGRSGFSGRELAVVVAAALLVGWGPAPYLATGLVAGGLVLSLVVARAYYSGNQVTAGAATSRM